MHASTIILGLLGLWASTTAATALPASDAAACRCTAVSNPGLYCGFCSQVVSGKVSNHAYECNTSGGCYDYGVSSRCATTNQRYCKGCDTWEECWDSSGIRTWRSRVSTSSYLQPRNSCLQSNVRYKLQQRSEVLMRRKLESILSSCF
jgi:hypothetical protein